MKTTIRIGYLSYVYHGTEGNDQAWRDYWSFLALDIWCSKPEVTKK